MLDLSFHQAHPASVMRSAHLMKNNGVLLTAVYAKWSFLVRNLFNALSLISELKKIVIPLLVHEVA